MRLFIIVHHQGGDAYREPCICAYLLMTQLSHLFFANLSLSLLPSYPQVVMVFDETCAMPAAVAIASMFMNCSQPKLIRLGIVDLGLSEASRERLQQLMPSHQAIDWLSAEHALRGYGSDGSSIGRVKFGLGYVASHCTSKVMCLATV